MKRATAPFLPVMLLCGIAINTMGATAESMQNEVTSEITCKPGFELQTRPEIHVVDAQGNARDSFRQWLILTDGKQHFRILWGSPPLSRGPVDLSSHLTYTFTISTKIESENYIHTVSRILKGIVIIYDASEKKKQFHQVGAGQPITRCLSADVGHKIDESSD